MTIFMYLLLPLILTLFCFCYKSRRNVPVIYMGIMASVIFCAVKMLFFYSHRIVAFSFSENFIYFLIRESFIPIVVICGLFFIFSKDEMEFKINSIFPLLTSFYIIYMPFVIYNSPSGYLNSFSLFVKPILYAVMLITIGISSKEIFKFIKNKNYLFVIIFASVVIIYLLIPAALESVYLITTSILWCVIGLVVYSAFPVIISILKTLKITKK